MRTALILFEVAGTTYGVDSSYVQQVEMIEKITRIPNAPSYVDGIVGIRGRVVPVINLRARFGYERIEQDLRGRLVVIAIDGRAVALAVDSAREFVSVDEGDILLPPEPLEEGREQFLAGLVHLAGRLILLVDPQAVIGNPPSTAGEASPAKAVTTRDTERRGL